MAATLAAGGKNPVTGKRLLDENKVPGVLAVMATAGLYDDSGKWLLSHRPARQERRRRRPHRRVARQVRHRGRIAAARRCRQQRARSAGHRCDFQRAGRQPTVRPVSLNLSYEEIMMLKHAVLAAALFGASAAPVLAQTPKVEVSVIYGFTFSDGVSGNNVVAGDGKHLQPPRPQGLRFAGVERRISRH